MMKFRISSKGSNNCQNGLSALSFMINGRVLLNTCTEGSLHEFASILNNDNRVL